MKRSTLSAVGWLLLVFASGVLVGVFGERLYSARISNAAGGRRPGGRPSAEEFRKHYVAEMRKRLSLTDPQVTDVEKILDDTRARFDAIRDRVRAEMKPIQEDQQNRIRALLNDTQRAEYAKMLAERDERDRKKRQEPGGGSGGGGRH